MPTAYYQSPIGLIRITATSSYIEEVHFCREDEHLELPAAGEYSPLLQNCTEQLIEYFQGVRRQFELPVHQEGTSFQQSVWSELCGIAYGKTISYTELARKLGDPKSIRAAASTNGRNRIAIIVPCHRVIGAKGDLVGYAGGLSRKRWLLQHEQKIAWGVQTLF
ncbi:methylated-DNA--[protein]-cysteine S-methyltransferase [Flavihumibacter petaseus]|uniref:Methylated-DNA--protein-cysteine methyltransferase n=1 Tax=Flavihumibacter petaseus NBRC 106054 TaxID=1220578 RepID=A0A0E9N3K7_9BACT|nr:methylated-DNA--[protein]-cysteine S-methyltransferase [Flavihumibacter petaseus]GAO43940.1 methylated-DNA--[protein]-cysteine methyltransferase [Flavihumibacter petaseus NBRC 106054]